MKKASMICFLIISLISKLDAQTKDTLTNQKVIQLTKIGLQPAVIIMKIQSSVAIFDVSTDALINLSNNKVSSDVITEMMKSVNKKEDETSSTANSSNPETMHQPGIYYFNAAEVTSPLKRVDGVNANYRTSGGGAYSFGGSTTLAVVSGIESNLKVKEAQPVFYFYFNNNANRNSDWFVSNSPNEFSLVKFIEKKGERLYKIGGSSSHAFGGSASSGIPEKTKIPFEYIQLSEGIYKVTFKEPLQKGEYCFVQGQNMRRAFDFSVSR